LPRVPWLKQSVARYLRAGAVMLFGTKIMAHLIEKQAFLRANAAFLLTFVGGGLAACAIGAVVYDIGNMVGAW
jgi:predicted tellurium resistance membrane protein TerC